MPPTEINAGTIFSPPLPPIERTGCPRPLMNTSGAIDEPGRFPGNEPIRLIIILHNKFS
jgi:hypothetical protein